MHGRRVERRSEAAFVDVATFYLRASVPLRWSQDIDLLSLSFCALLARFFYMTCSNLQLSAGYYSIFSVLVWFRS
jgi:hypothetical protein